LDVVRTTKGWDKALDGLGEDPAMVGTIYSCPPWRKPSHGGRWHVPCL